MLSPVDSSYIILPSVEGSRYYQIRVYLITFVREAHSFLCEPLILKSILSPASSHIKLLANLIIGEIELDNSLLIDSDCVMCKCVRSK